MLEVSFLLLSIFISSFVSLKILKYRGFQMDFKNKFAICLIFSLEILWAGIFFEDMYIVMSIVGIFPLILIISLIDVKEKLVYDEDIICGIIIEIVISFFFEIEGIFTFIDEISVYELSNSINISLFDYIKSYIYRSIENFFTYGISFNMGLIQSFLAVILVFMFTYVLAKVSGSMGMGDVMYFSFLAMFANFWGCILIFFASFITCFFYCLALTIMNKDLKNGLISFTPFISISFVIFFCIAY